MRRPRGHCEPDEEECVQPRRRRAREKGILVFDYSATAPFDGFCLERSFVKAHAEEMRGMLVGPTGRAGGSDPQG